MSSRAILSCLLLASALAGCGGSTPATSNQADRSPAPAPSHDAPAAPAATAPPPAGASADAMPADLPPLPVTDFPAARPMPVVRAVYTFAAEHPEVLSKVPCFCGCESRGHRDNDDCFVASRNAAGKVTGWEPHGVG
jgi:hypothetical protein